VSPEDWLHAIIAALYHDIGYIRGVCAGDRDGRFVADQDGATVALPRGASDAALALCHVERSKIAVRNASASMTSSMPSGSPGRSS
jgi:hypothetical protein